MFEFHYDGADCTLFITHNLELWLFKANTGLLKEYRVHPLELEVLFKIDRRAYIEKNTIRLMFPDCIFEWDGIWTKIELHNG